MNFLNESTKNAIWWAGGVWVTGWAIYGAVVKAKEASDRFKDVESNSRIMVTVGAGSKGFLIGGVSGLLFPFSMILNTIGEKRLSEKLGPLEIDYD